MAGTIMSMPNKCRPISSTRTGAASAAPIQKRRVISMSSGLGPALAVGVIGSSAMPQIGHEPGPSRTISGCIGHVHFAPFGTSVVAVDAACLCPCAWHAPCVSSGFSVAQHDLASPPLAYFSGAATNFALQPALQNNTSSPLCDSRCGVSPLTIMPQTGSRNSAAWSCP